MLARGDDHPGQALEYYASRGEAPLLWGGSGARVLGLEGAVTDEQYEAVYGVGGACDPTTGEPLVRTTRPGLELVVSAHKSVAELCVIGRAEDMHAIMDAERDATLAYLDDLTQRIGGRRGKANGRTPTEGLIYAAARHATSRAAGRGRSPDASGGPSTRERPLRTRPAASAVPTPYRPACAMPVWSPNATRWRR